MTFEYETPEMSETELMLLAVIAGIFALANLTVIMRAVIAAIEWMT